MDQPLRPGAEAGAGGHGTGGKAHPTVLQALSAVGTGKPCVNTIDAKNEQSNWLSQPDIFKGKI